MKKPIKYILGILTILVVLFLSFRIEKLDEYKAAKTVTIFDAINYVQDVWNNKMPAIINDAPEIVSLVELLKTNKQKAFEDFGKKLGISKTWYFMAKGEGVVDSVMEESLRIDIGQNNKIQLATSFIFGNAVRDASGSVNIDDFINITDFNNVSVAINKLVKEEVANELKNSAKPGMKLQFAGAIEVNEENTNLNTIRVIPVSVKFSNEQ